jgi:hypothetical protein
VASHTRAGTGPEREQSLNRGRREARECRGFLGPPVRRTALLRGRHQAAPLQESIDPPRDEGHDFRHVVPRETASRMKGQPAAVRREHAIDHQRVEMDVEVQRAPEPLNHHDSPAPAIGDAAPPRAGPQEAEDGSHVHAHHRATQIMIPREPVPQAIREAQHPLPNRDVGQHMVNEVRRAFGHAAAAATRTEAPPLARERHEPILARIRRSGNARIPPRDTRT